MPLAVSPPVLLGDTVNKIAEFDDQLTRTASNLEMFKDRNLGLFNRLGEEIRKATLGTRFLADQGAVAVNTFAEAGFNATQSLAGLKPALELAQSRFVSVEQAGEISSAAMRQFGQDAAGVGDAEQQLRRVNDVLVAAQLEGLSTVERLGETFRTGGPIAQVAGTTIEEFTALAVALSKVGIVGPEAGTAIRRGFQRIATAPKDFRGAIRTLNIDIDKFVEKS